MYDTNIERPSFTRGDLGRGSKVGLRRGHWRGEGRLGKAVGVTVDGLHPGESEDDTHLEQRFTVNLR